MARPSTGTNLTIAQLEQILNQRRHVLDRLYRRRSVLERKLAGVDKEISRLEGAGAGLGRRRGGGGGLRVRNEKPLPEVIDAVLRGAGKPMAVQDIANAVLATGYRSNSDNFRGIVNQMLIKDRKRFGQVERGIYQLNKKPEK